MAGFVLEPNPILIIVFDVPYCSEGKRRRCIHCAMQMAVESKRIIIGDTMKKEPGLMTAVRTIPIAYVPVRILGLMTRMVYAAAADTIEAILDAYAGT